jgi:NhaP-type Na+/H+ or K+/H+ antiporter
MKKILIAGAAYALPMFALAQSVTGNLGGALTTVGQLIKLIVPIVGGVLLIYFFIGVWGYVNAGGDEEGRAAARNKMIYSIIGMFVAFLFSD